MCNALTARQMCLRMLRITASTLVSLTCREQGRRVGPVLVGQDHLLRRRQMEALCSVIRRDEARCYL